MFDTQTAELIRSAPALEGLDLDSLPKQLTEAYSTIVSLRLRLREVQTAETLDPDLANTIRELERLAFAQEAFVAIAPNRPNRVAAAFVAASAHHLRFSAQVLLGIPDRPSQLSAEAIGPEIAATLLFLIAARPADAAQMSRSIRVANDGAVEDLLRLAVIDLARGQLVGITEREWEVGAEPVFDEGLATRLLWADLLRGVRALALRLLGALTTSSLSGVDPGSLFSTVREVSVQRVEFDGAAQVLSVLPGPHHLASLLFGVSDVLDESGVVNIASPPSVSPEAWQEFLKKLAQRRPYLWPNHREAIEAGYLNSGTSAVVSFPTGAGKSTLAELKIAIARLLGQKVVYLAPTLALVNQVATDVRKTFPEARTTEADELEPEDLTNVAVMTPERCLTLLGFSPSAFENVGLLVFDECHLMHPREGAARRSVDAMLCLLAFLRAAPSADVLLISAMISNAEELAKWLTELTGRPALPLALTWKPTRQARGCVVYPSDRITELSKILKASARSSRQKSIPKAVRDQLNVQPFGMFSLLQTWQTRDEKDYTLLRLLNEDVFLDAAKKTPPGGSFPSTYLTANRNSVAAALAARSGDAGIKTLVFSQTIPFCLSIQKKSEELMTGRAIALTADEELSKSQAISELGNEECTYCQAGLAASHHGLLLPVERQFNESLFRRAEGAHVLVATSTLAQGMNLPSQMVIIAGDDRFDIELSKVLLLEAHELLNAAGRAGRAGEAAEGMVILVPGKVIAYDELKTTMSKHWFDLQELFSNSDQCLELEDPLESILDRIHQSTTALDSDATYLLRRLPIKIGEGEEAARELLTRSFISFRRRQSGNVDWITARVDAAMAARRRITSFTDSVTWEDELAATAGILNAEHIRAIAASLDLTDDVHSRTTPSWIDWGLDWLVEHPDAFGEVVREENIISVFGKSAEGFQNDADKTQEILDKIRKVLPLWMGGIPLTGIEKALTSKPSKKCDVGREWSIRLVPDLAYFFGLIPQVYRRMKEAQGGIAAILASAIPNSFLTLGRCVREGFDHPDKTALHHVLGATVPRVVTHQNFALIADILESGPDYEPFSDTVRRVRLAWKQRPASH